MRKNFNRIFLMVLFLTVIASHPAMGAEVDKASSNASSLGFLTVLPPLIAIAFAFITKNVVISLFLGTVLGLFLINIISHNAFTALILSFLDLSEKVLNSLADPWNAGIILQVLAIGGIISLVGRMGGTKAVAEALAKKAKGPVSAQIITWVLGLFVFFDDYANSLIVGPIMRPVTDKMKVSREKLSFIIDSTAAPISGIAIISTWVGYELTLIKDAYGSISNDTVDAFGIFIETIPFRFYNILILAFIVFTVIFLKEFGPMHKAEMRARTTGKVTRDGANPMGSEEMDTLEPKEGVRLNIWNAIIPIGVLIIGAFLGFYYNGYMSIFNGEDEALKVALNNSPLALTSIQAAFGKSDASVVLFQAALLSSVVAMAMGVSQKIFTIGEALETWVSGMKSLIMTGVILLLAWSLSAVIKDLGTAKYLVSVLSDAIPYYLLPGIIFILAAIISFATGTSYGTMGILMPLAIPLAHGILPDHDFIIIATSSVLTGAIFGDHCSPISDTTILSSMGASCDFLDHVKTQMPYAVVVAIFSVIAGYIPVSLGIPVYIVLPLSIILLGAIVYFVGKPVEENKPQPMYESGKELNTY
ncbi:Na+/H+ antiporter NhaC family protein [Clostridium hydrogeniformans]|uniref:Na+/H+ antiporter NhaC family protein n=1 Tax=Clostridium hydrogeniformans TaxID=349933 RepID=UPI000488DB7C|nr:Na+/H+ antiporter NhaC family protein [Clostridium hydrogeniformans]